MKRGRRSRHASVGPRARGGVMLISLSGLPEIRGTRNAKKVVASRGKVRLRREGSCYYSEPEAAAVYAGVAVTRKSLNAGGSGSSRAAKIWSWRVVVSERL